MVFLALIVVGAALAIALARLGALTDAQKQRERDIRALESRARSRRWRERGL